MDTAPITLSYRHPSAIDADTPAEVRAIACAQLEDLAPRLRELVEATARQVRNAALDDFLADTGGDLDKASAKLTEWENGDDRAAIDRLFRLGGLLESAAAEVGKLPPK